ncbi:MAG: helix-turn-helix domain-containing protein [Brevundimonas sp.]|nr:helix-turn-helix domain-containing protein [Brevundimonas sp.]
MVKPFVRSAVRDPEHVRLLSSPVRQEVVDTLAALGGEASIAAMAEHLGRPADGLYYHVRALAESGLVEEASTADDERLYRLGGEGPGPIRLAYDLGAQGNGRELGAFAKALVQVAVDDFGAALKATETVAAGPDRDLWASRNKGWVSKEDLREISRLLERLSELTSQRKATGRERLVSLAFVLAPLSPRPRRRLKAEQYDSDLRIK